MLEKLRKFEFFNVNFKKFIRICFISLILDKLLKVVQYLYLKIGAGLKPPKP